MIDLQFFFPLEQIAQQSFVPFFDPIDFLSFFGALWYYFSWRSGFEKSKGPREPSKALAHQYAESIHHIVHLFEAFLHANKGNPECKYQSQILHKHYS